MFIILGYKSSVNYLIVKCFLPALQSKFYFLIKSDFYLLLKIVVIYSFLKFLSLLQIYSNNILVLHFKLCYLMQNECPLQLKKIPTELIGAFERIAKYDLTCLLKPWLFQTMSRKEVFLIRCHDIGLIREYTDNYILMLHSH